MSIPKPKTHQKAIGPFPAHKVEADIRCSLADVASREATLQGLPDPSSGSGLMPVIDSLIVVELLVVLEDVVSLELPENLIKRGGYESIDEAVADLLPKIERCWLQHYGRAK